MSTQPSHPSRMPPAESEGNLSLEDAASYMLEECRMVLPGIQSLFGFQLIAVFNQAFSTRLSGFEQKLHLGAIVLVVVSIALVMAPAALHRQREPRSVSENFLAVSSRLLLWSMLPLALGISLDVFLVSRVILRSSTGALALAGVLFGVFVLLWYGLPRRRVMRRLAQR